jgi:hypothetical protein
MLHVSKFVRQVPLLLFGAYAVLVPVVRAQNTITNDGDSASLFNPLQSQTIPEFLLKIIDVLLVFALPLIILYIMYAGYLFVTAQGTPAKVSEARSALLWAVVGGVIVLGAKIIVGVIQGTITAF